jgi:hypothetical protein
MNIFKKLFAIAVLVLGMSCVSRAQTTYQNVEVGVNAGDHSWATFYFGHPLNGSAGTTALFVQCAFHRAELITDYDYLDQYQQQMVSEFFAVNCSMTSGYVGGVYTTTYTINATPLMESLVMRGTNYYGQPVTQPLNLILNSGSWLVSGGGRYTKTTGSSEITY